MNNNIDEIYSCGQLPGARKENTASLLFKKTYMLKLAGLKMVSRVDLGVLDNIRSACMISITSVLQNWMQNGQKSDKQ